MTDGGVADSIPVIKAYEMGAREITVILSRSRGYKKKATKTSWLTKQIYKGYPALINAALNRADVYNKSIDFIENPPSDCIVNIIAPPKHFKVGRTTKSFNILNKGYQMGITEARAHLQAP